MIIAGSAEEPLAIRLPDISFDYARCLGSQHRKELADLVRNSLAIMMHSICYENQPVCVLNAFGAGKPVIDSGLRGMTGLILYQERSLPVTRGDPSALAEAVNWNP